MTTVEPRTRNRIGPTMAIAGAVLFALGVLLYELGKADDMGLVLSGVGLSALGGLAALLGLVVVALRR